MNSYQMDPVLSKWVNQKYLEQSKIDDIRESVLAKPYMQYVVLDDFFNEDIFRSLVEHHFTLQFSEEMDRRAADGTWLPYDGAVQFATPRSIGGDLFFSQVWHRWCADVLSAQLESPSRTDVKLRYHRHYADGFWIHTDGGIRQIVMICYFNRGWRASDGGLLQLWKPEESILPGTPIFDGPTGRMDFLSMYKRIRTSTPGGGWGKLGDLARDVILIDQVVPSYNRVFLCNFQTDACYHSVTPSNGKVRYGVVQWIGV